VRNGRARARARLCRWVAILGATTVALTFAATASAASAALTGCAEVPAGYAITFSGGGFASDAVVTVYDNGALRGRPRGTGGETSPTSPC